jgi:hypothetical protein
VGENLGGNNRTIQEARSVHVLLGVMSSYEHMSYLPPDSSLRHGHSFSSSTFSLLRHSTPSRLILTHPTPTHSTPTHSTPTYSTTSPSTPTHSTPAPTSTLDSLHYRSTFVPISYLQPFSPLRYSPLQVGLRSQTPSAHLQPDLQFLNFNWALNYS